MYKVFFNESFLIFASKDEKIDLGNSNILEIENFNSDRNLACESGKFRNYWKYCL